MMKVAIETNFGRREGEMNQNTQLAPNFLLYEVSNLSGNAKEPQYYFSEKSNKHIQALQYFRGIVNQSVNVNSGYRQPAYNRQIGGDNNSAHLLALATDIKPLKGMTNAEVISAWFAALQTAGINQGAINIYNGYYHLESYSQDLYNYPKPYTVRVYTTDAEYNQLKATFKYQDYNYIRVKK